jgi:hypothetical protein
MLPNPTDSKDGMMTYESMQKLMETRRCELNAELLAFERDVRPKVKPLDDGNAVMGAFTHRMNGGAIYVLPDGLVEEFDNTDCGEVHIGDIQLPFPNVYLKFTPPNRPLLGDGAPVDGCYAVWQQDELLLVLTSCMPAVDYEHSLSIACTDPMFSIHMPATKRDMPINAAVELGIQEFLETNAPPTENISQDVTFPDGTVTHIEDVRKKSRQKRIEVFRSQEPAFRECLNIIINAACFISFKPDDVTEEWEGQNEADGSSEEDRQWRLHSDQALWQSTFPRRTWPAWSRKIPKSSLAQGALEETAAWPWPAFDRSSLDPTHIGQKGEWRAG